MSLSGADSYWVCLGSYKRNPEEGITPCELNAKSCKLKKLKVFFGIKNPSFLSIHPKEYLYACHETGMTDGRKGGAVSSFHIDPETRNLTKLNQTITQGSDPCYLGLNPRGYPLVQLVRSAWALPPSLSLFFNNPDIPELEWVTVAL